MIFLSFIAAFFTCKKEEKYLCKITPARSKENTIITVQTFQ